MDFNQIITIVFTVAVIPCLGILTAWLVSFINKKKEELKTKVDNELLQKYMDMLARTVSTCVVATNQTYVNTLKQKDEFGIEAQKAAFKMTFDNIMSILSEEAINYLTTFCGDITATVSNMIEHDVAYACNRFITVPDVSVDITDTTPIE